MSRTHHPPSHRSCEWAINRVCPIFLALGCLLLAWMQHSRKLPSVTLSPLDSSHSKPIVIFTVTRYRDKSDPRFRTCIATLTAAVTRKFPIVVVDSSPDPALRRAMADAGALVSEQTAEGQKGNALREALHIAGTLPGVGPDTLLCWQEPEKTDMVRHWTRVAARLSSTRADIAIPAREPALFMATYPAEQFHSESFANSLVSAMAAKGGLQLVGAGEPPIDWHFGPLAFRQRRASYWLADRGELWDAQLMPLVRAARAGHRLVSVEVAFSAPAAMKQEEEGNLKFMEKRLVELNFLALKFKEALESPPP
eukprot:EG_transcript_19418